MPFDVFISYSHKDKNTMDLMCATLEKNGLKCWVAPRDIIPGMEWSAAIIQGIESTKIMVLVFSNHSNISSQVVREVERAVSKNITIIPFKIEDVKMSQSMEYLVSMSHWLNACDQPLQKKLLELVDNIKSLIKKDDSVSMHSNRNATNPRLSQPFQRARTNFFSAFTFGKVFLGLIVFIGGISLYFNQHILNTAGTPQVEIAESVSPKNDISTLKSIPKEDVKKNDLSTATKPDEPLATLKPKTIDKKSETEAKSASRKSTETSTPSNKKNAEKKSETDSKVPSKKNVETPPVLYKKTVEKKIDEYKIGSIKLEMKTKVVGGTQIDFMFSAYNAKNNFAPITDWLGKNQTVFQNKIVQLGLAEGVWIPNPSANKWPPLVNNDIATFQYSFKKSK